MRAALPGPGVPDGVLVGSPGGCYMKVHVQPGARWEGVVGLHGAALKIAVTAPAVGGKANQAAARLLSEALGLKPSALSLVGGQRSRDKRFFVAGAEVGNLAMALSRLGLAQAD